MLPKDPVLGPSIWARWERIGEIWFPDKLVGLRSESFLERGVEFRLPKGDYFLEMLYFWSRNNVLLITVPAYGKIRKVHDRAPRIVTREVLKDDNRRLQEMYGRLQPTS
ncbi:MAG: hypothetical protein D6698_16685 [Gammaproteobacteria bacterium]|nr:MAG: hypothetical protein D6698_16685 [Gammaproteobacteria bacterium]